MPNDASTETLDLWTWFPAPGGAESDNSEMATVAVDGGGQASGTHGPLPDPQTQTQNQSKIPFSVKVLSPAASGVLVSEIVEFGGLGGPGSPGNPYRRWGSFAPHPF